MWLFQRGKAQMWKPDMCVNHLIFFCLNGNVCKSVQIYKSFYSTSKLPGHSSCLFWCNRKIKPTRAQDIMIQFVWATKQSPFPQKPAAAKKKRQKIVQMLMVGHMFLTASNQNCLWNLLISWMDTCWTPHLSPWDYEERMCISKSFQQPCAISGDEGWVCIMIIERNKKHSYLIPDHLWKKVKSTKSEAPFLNLVKRL